MRLPGRLSSANPRPLVALRMVFEALGEHPGVTAVSQARVCRDFPRRFAKKAGSNGSCLSMMRSRPGEGRSMTGRRSSIAASMTLTAIIASNLAMLRLVPAMVFQVPVFVFVIVGLDLALLHLVFGRPLRAFYFSLLISGSLFTGAITALFFSEAYPAPGPRRRGRSTVWNLRSPVTLVDHGQVMWPGCTAYSHRLSRPTGAWRA